MLVESRIASHQKLKEDFYQKYEEIYQAVVSAKAKVNGGDLNLTNKYIKLIQKVKGDQELTEFLIEHFMNDPGSVFAWNKE
jgi:hypothetical protein